MRLSLEIEESIVECAKIYQYMNIITIKYSKTSFQDTKKDLPRTTLYIHNIRDLHFEIIICRTKRIQVMFHMLLIKLNACSIAARSSPLIIRLSMVPNVFFLQTSLAMQPSHPEEKTRTHSCLGTLLFPPHFFHTHCFSHLRPLLILSLKCPHLCLPQSPQPYF